LSNLSIFLHMLTHSYTLKVFTYTIYEHYYFLLLDVFMYRRCIFSEIDTCSIQNSKEIYRTHSIFPCSIYVKTFIDATWLNSANNRPVLLCSILFYEFFISCDSPFKIFRIFTGAQRARPFPFLFCRTSTLVRLSYSIYHNYKIREILNSHDVHIVHSQDLSTYSTV
jgi:hypothetical protein